MHDMFVQGSEKRSFELAMVVTQSGKLYALNS